jgi:hypothetical protein
MIRYIFVNAGLLPGFSPYFTLEIDLVACFNYGCNIVFSVMSTVYSVYLPVLILVQVRMTLRTGQHLT